MAESHEFLGVFLLQSVYETLFTLNYYIHSRKKKVFLSWYIKKWQLEGWWDEAISKMKVKWWNNEQSDKISYFSVANEVYI